MSTENTSCNVINIKEFGTIPDNPKGFLIELSGNAKGCSVVPTCCIKYCSIKDGEYCIDINIINSLGFEGFTRITGGHYIYISHIAFGTEECLQ